MAYDPHRISSPQRVPQVSPSPTTAQIDRDIDANPVPTWKAHTYTYDDGGNVATDTVTDGDRSWVRSYTWQNGLLVTDSGWIPQ